MVSLIGSLSLHAGHNKQNNYARANQLQGEFIEDFLSRLRQDDFRFQFSLPNQVTAEARRENIRQQKRDRLERSVQNLRHAQNNESRSIRSRANSFTEEVAQVVASI